MRDYNHSNLSRARALRREMTPWERKLWYLFLKSYPQHFYRQKPIGNYITDFYCSSANLVLELDGSGHYEAEQEEYDAKRSSYLNECGIRVIRISNSDIDSHFPEVCQMIDLAVQQASK